MRILWFIWYVYHYVLSVIVAIIKWKIMKSNTHKNKYKYKYKYQWQWL